MREFLFRGKRKDNGEWVEGFFAGEDCELPLSPMKEQSNIIEKGSGWWREVVSETVGQYTGLTDKNGKKIFEGDILEVLAYYKNGKSEEKPGLEDTSPFDEPYPKRTKTIWTVEWKTHNTQMGFFTYGKNRRWFRPLTNSRLYNADAVVVGNIHDNPELLKEEQPCNS